MTLFREMVFALAEEATEEVDAATPENFQNRTCIWRALCRVFYEMQSGSAESPVEIDDLLSALGMDKEFEQVDAREVHRRLLDALQEAFERRLAADFQVIVDTCIRTFILTWQKAKV